MTQDIKIYNINNNNKTAKMCRNLREIIMKFLKNPLINGMFLDLIDTSHVIEAANKLKLKAQVMMTFLKKIERNHSHHQITNNSNYK